MKLQIPILLLLLSLVFVSCIRREESSSANMTIVNQTSHDVRLLFTSIFSEPDSNVFLPPNHQKSFMTPTYLGKNSAKYQILPILSYDTCRVLFNDTLELVYVVYEKMPRNIWFTRNYEETIEDKTKRHRIFNYLYRITEEDFLNAKPL